MTSRHDQLLTPESPRLGLMAGLVGRHHAGRVISGTIRGIPVSRQADVTGRYTLAGCAPGYRS